MTAQRATMPTDNTTSRAIVNFRVGRQSFAELLAIIRREVLILPISEADDVLVGDARGLGWVYAFTGLGKLARFARARDAGDQSWPYVSMRGAMVLDHVLADAPRPCGLAIDVADAHPILLPPVVGVVAAAQTLRWSAGRDGSSTVNIGVAG